MNSRHDCDTHTPQRGTDGEAVAGLILVPVIGVLSAIAIVHWPQCTQDAVALCFGPVLIRLQHLRWRWADRAWQAVRACCLRAQLAWEEDALDNMIEAHRDLPGEIAHQRRLVGALRADAIVAANAARGEA